MKSVCWNCDGDIRKKSLKPLLHEAITGEH